MKVILEGNPDDINKVLKSESLIYKSAQSELKLESALAKIKKLSFKKVEDSEIVKSNNQNTSNEYQALNHKMQDLEKQLAAHKAALSFADSENKRLNLELKDMSRFSEDQIKQIDEKFQEHLKSIGVEPVIFSNEKKAQITAAEAFKTVFIFLAEGKKIHAIRAIREISGLGIIQSKELVDRAMLAFDCKKGTNNLPTPIYGN